MDKKLSIGFAITGSFCTHPSILDVIARLTTAGHNIYPILSTNTSSCDTRFGTAKNFIKNLEEITQNKILDNIVDVEPTGPQNLFDVIVVAPCTGNTLAKIALGINDTPVTMATKAHVRNNKPVIIGISTNDALGLNFKNLATLFASKNFFFVPFGQDNPAGKPQSLVANWDLLEKTISLAINHKQIQPVLI